MPGTLAMRSWQHQVSGAGHSRFPSLFFFLSSVDFFLYPQNFNL